MTICPDSSGYGFLVYEDGVDPVHFENAQKAFDYNAGRLSLEERNFWRERHRTEDRRRQPDGGLLTPPLATER